MRRIDIIRNWIENYIIQLNLCPYAKVPFKKDRIGYYDMEEIAVSNFSEFASAFLGSEEDTRFLILPMSSYEVFLDMYYFIEEQLDESTNGIKLVPFHPELVHEKIEHNYLNYTNRAPLPIVQFLRTEMLDKVSEEESEKILTDNENTLRKLGVESLQNKLDEY